MFCDPHSKFIFKNRKKLLQQSLMNFSIVKDDSDQKSNSFLTSRSEESLINHTIINLLLCFFVGSLLDTNLASHLCLF